MLPRVPAMLAHYRLLECIDSGGMGVVYRAHNTHLDCDVAIKILPSHVLDDSEARRKLRHEAHLLSKLHNPHVAVVHDYDRQDDVDFIVLEYVPGTTLAERIAPGPLPESVGLDLGIQLADGLAAVHAAGLVHCDVTPRNIRITPDGRLKLLDFGLARHVRNAHEGSTTTSASLGGAFGTPPYMAPEMLDEGRFDARVDIYATGTVLYEMATGRKPFDADTPGRLVQAILHELPLAPRSLNSRVSAGFESVILKALDKDPKRRYQSAPELLVDLVRLREGVTATSPSARTPPSQRRRWWVAAAGVAFAFVALALGRASYVGTLRATDLVPVVSWPGEKFGSRLSPDAEWVSFVARHGGRYGLWLRKLTMTEPRLLQESTATIASHAWSPDGEQIALLLDEKDGTYLRCIPSQGGPTLWSLQLEPPFGTADLVRWIGAKVYLDVWSDGLWTLDLATGAKARVVPASSADGSRVDFDVAPDTQRVLFRRVKGTQSTLWTCGTDGADERAVRDGAVDDNHALWLDARGNRLVFSPAQDGPSDLWSVDPAGRDPIRLTFGSNAEWVDDVALDGSGLTFRDRRDASALWLLPPGRGSRPRRLTSENALDLWPTANDAGEVVFQRSEPAIPDSMLHGARLFRLRPEASLNAATPLAARGGEALVSPEGRFVAYTRRDRPSPTGQVWMADERTEHTWRVATDMVLPNLEPFPVEGHERMMAWRRTGPTLYWVARQGVQHTICRWQPGSAAGGEVVVEDSEAASITDLHVSPDDRWLAYVRSSRQTPPRRELRCYDLEANRHHTLPTVVPADPDRLSLIGWIDGRGLLVARLHPNPDWTYQLELCSLTLDGAVTPLGTVDHAFVGAARLDRARRTLLVTRASDDGVHNIHALDLRTFRLDRLTDNELQGVGYSGITPLPDGSILFVQHERNESIWFVRIEGTTITEGSGSWIRRIKSRIS